jgi:citrate lyase subunit beta / citryl-CoA lyase
MTKPMNARRSWLIVPAHQPENLSPANEVMPDVTVLDLEYSVPPRLKDETRESLKGLVKSLGENRDELFVRIDRAARWADAAAAITRGVKGIVLPGPDSPDEVRELASLMTQKEKENGVEPGTTELVLMIESANGFWNLDKLAAASPRVTALGVGRIDLTMRLGPVPQGEFRLYRFLMTRLLVAARMLRKQPLGAFWRPDSRGGVATKEATMKAAKEGRIMGFTGCLCATPEQVAPINEGFAQARA